jgi:hypothetical protein
VREEVSLLSDLVCSLLPRDWASLTGAPREASSCLSETALLSAGKTTASLQIVGSPTSLEPRLPPLALKLSRPALQRTLAR